MYIVILHLTFCNRGCLVCAHRHVLSTKFYKFGGFWLVWFVNLQGVYHYKEVGANQNHLNKFFFLWFLWLYNINQFIIYFTKLDKVFICFNGSIQINATTYCSLWILYSFWVFFLHMWWWCWCWLCLIIMKLFQMNLVHVITGMIPWMTTSKLYYGKLNGSIENICLENEKWYTIPYVLGISRLE